MRVNDQIRIPVVNVIHENRNLGSMRLDAAKKMAFEAGLDLVEVSPNVRPPVCKIMDYGKFKYEQSVKEKKNKSKQHLPKELHLTPVISEHDLETKIKAARGFLETGHQVHLKVISRGKRVAQAQKGLALEMMLKSLKMLEDVGAAKKPPQVSSGQVLAIIDPKA